MSAWRIGAEASAQSGRRSDMRSREGNRSLDIGTSRGAGEPPKHERLQAVFDQLTKWIPGDTLALYVPGVTVLATGGGPPSVPLLLAMIVVTPLFVLLSAFAAGNKLTKRVWVAAALGALAFIIWSMSVPLSGWQKWSLVANNGAGFAIGAAIAGLLFSYAAEGVLKRLPAV
jgi:hypothetical protein